MHYLPFLRPPASRYPACLPAHAPTLLQVIDGIIKQAEMEEMQTGFGGWLRRVHGVCVWACVSAAPVARSPARLLC